MFYICDLYDLTFDSRTVCLTISDDSLIGSRGQVNALLHDRVVTGQDCSLSGVPICFLGRLILSRSHVSCGLDGCEIHTVSY